MKVNKVKRGTNRCLVSNRYFIGYTRLFGHRIYKWGVPRYRFF